MSALSILCLRNHGLLLLIFCSDLPIMLNSKYVDILYLLMFVCLFIWLVYLCFYEWYHHCYYRINRLSRRWYKNAYFLFFFITFYKILFCNVCCIYGTLKFLMSDTRFCIQVEKLSNLNNVLNTKYGSACLFKEIFKWYFLKETNFWSKIKWRDQKACDT